MCEYAVTFTLVAKLHEVLPTGGLGVALTEMATAYPNPHIFETREQAVASLETWWPSFQEWINRRRKK